MRPAEAELRREAEARRSVARLSSVHPKWPYASRTSPVVRGSAQLRREPNRDDLASNDFEFDPGGIDGDPRDADPFAFRERVSHGCDCLSGLLIRELPRRCDNPCGTRGCPNWRSIEPIDSQDSVTRMEQIGLDEVGTALSTHQTISWTSGRICLNSNRPASRCSSRFNVAFLIPDHPAILEFDFEFTRGVDQHSWSGLAPGVLDSKFGDGAVWVKRTEDPLCDEWFARSPFRFALEQFSGSSVNGVDITHAVSTSRNSTLICHDDDCVSRLAQCADSPRCAGKESDEIGVAQVTVIRQNRVVSIEKNATLHSRRLAQDGPHVLNRSSKIPHSRACVRRRRRMTSQAHEPR